MTKIIDLPTTTSTDANTFVPVYQNGKTKKVSATALGGGGSGSLSADFTSLSTVSSVDGTEVVAVNKPLGTALRTTVQNILNWILAKANTWTAKQTFNGDVTVSGTLGYGTGAGGTVTQPTSKSTTVTLNKSCGTISTHNETSPSGTSFAFFLNNSVIAATDAVYVQVADGSALNYTVSSGAVSNGQVGIYVRNVSNSSRAEVVPIRFIVLKGSNS